MDCRPGLSCSGRKVLFTGPFCRWVSQLLIWCVQPLEPSAELWTVEWHGLIRNETCCCTMDQFWTRSQTSNPGVCRWLLYQLSHCRLRTLQTLWGQSLKFPSRCWSYVVLLYIKIWLEKPEPLSWRAWAEDVFLSYLSRDIRETGRNEIELYNGKERVTCHLHRNDRKTHLSKLKT